jgi:hypothetical protein
MTDAKNRVTVMLSDEQAERVESILDDSEQHPILSLNQSDVVRMLLDAGLEQLDDPEQEIVLISREDDPLTLSDLLD